MMQCDAGERKRLDKIMYGKRLHTIIYEKRLYTRRGCAGDVHGESDERRRSKAPSLT